MLVRQAAFYYVKRYYYALGNKTVLTDWLATTRRTKELQEATHAHERKREKQRNARKEQSLERSERVVNERSEKCEGAII